MAGRDDWELLLEHESQQSNRGDWLGPGRLLQNCVLYDTLGVLGVFHFLIYDSRRETSLFDEQHCNGSPKGKWISCSTRTLTKRISRHAVAQFL